MSELKRPAAGPLGDECCPILIWYRIQAAQQSWVFFVAICVSRNVQMFSVGERSGWQADQSSTWTLLLQSHATVVDAACGLE